MAYLYAFDLGDEMSIQAQNLSKANVAIMRETASNEKLSASPTRRIHSGYSSKEREPNVGLAYIYIGEPSGRYFSPNGQG